MPLMLRPAPMKSAAEASATNAATCRVGPALQTSGNAFVSAANPAGGDVLAQRSIGSSRFRSWGLWAGLGAAGDHAGCSVHDGNGTDRADHSGAVDNQSPGNRVRRPVSGQRSSSATAPSGTAIPIVLAIG